MKFQILFPGKIRKNMLSAENFTQSAKHLPVTPNMYSMHVEKYEKITVLFDKNKKNNNRKQHLIWSPDYICWYPACFRSMNHSSFRMYITHLCFTCTSSSWMPLSHRIILTNQKLLLLLLLLEDIFNQSL